MFEQFKKLFEDMGQALGNPSTWGMTPEQMAAWNAWMQQQQQAMNAWTMPVPQQPLSLASWEANSEATCNAIESYSQEAILNQTYMTNPDTGQNYCVDNTAGDYYWVDPGGSVVATQTYDPPDYSSNWTQLDSGYSY